MTKRAITISIAVTVSLILSLAGCVSTPKYFEYGADEIFSLETDDASISLTFIPEEELTRRFGSKGNVFAEYPAMIIKKQSVVYRLDVTAKNSPLKIDLRNIVLTIGDVSSQSRYRSRLLDDWSTYIKKPDDMERATGLTDRYMFNNNFTVIPGEPVSGLIVFLKAFPEDIERSIKIGLESPDKSIEEVQFDLY